MKQMDKNEATCLRLFQYKIPLIILADHFELDNDQSSVETSHAFIVSVYLKIIMGKDIGKEKELRKQVEVQI